MNGLLARHRYVLFLTIALAMLGALGYGLAQRPARVTFTVLPPPPTPQPTPTPTQGPVRCHVAGAVQAPGVYTLPPGSSVQDAVQEAGGPTADADLERLNLAAVVQDQGQIVVPSQQMDSVAGGTGGGLININSADSETLQTLPGIGPALAERILAHREQNGPFDTLEDLTDVKGIGPATLEKLQPLICVDP